MNLRRFILALGVAVTLGLAVTACTIPQATRVANCTDLGAGTLTIPGQTIHPVPVKDALSCGTPGINLVLVVTWAPPDSGTQVVFGQFTFRKSNSH